jgi:hypothetical protein
MSSIDDGLHADDLRVADRGKYATPINPQSAECCSGSWRRARRAPPPPEETDDFGWNNSRLLRRAAGACRCRAAQTAGERVMNNAARQATRTVTQSIVRDLRMLRGDDVGAEETPPLSNSRASRPRRANIKAEALPPHSKEKRRTLRSAVPASKTPIETLRLALQRERGSFSNSTEARPFARSTVVGSEVGAN